MGVSVRSSILVVLLAPLAALLAARVQVLSLAYFNAQERMPKHANFSSYEVKFADQIRNCEDAVLVETKGIALLACDPGRENWNTVMGDFVDGEPDPNAELYAWNYGDEEDSLAPIKVVGFDAELRTIGFEYHEPSSTLFVTNHGRQGSRIEQFDLDLDTLTATHVRTVVHPLISIPNSIAAVSASEFYVTNQHYFIARENRLLWMLETYLAPPFATVVHVHVLENGTVDAAVVARQAYPNGIVLLNETTLAVASSSKRTVNLYTVSPATADAAGQGGQHPSLQLADSFWLPFLPDNLAVSKEDGALLVAGHPHLPSLNKFARSRKICSRPEVLEAQGEEGQALCAETGAASWAVEWTPEGGVKDIYAGWEYPTSASVVRDKKRRVGIVAGLYAKGLLVWRD